MKKSVVFISILVVASDLDAQALGQSKHFLLSQLTTVSSAWSEGQNGRVFHYSKIKNFDSTLPLRSSSQKPPLRKGRVIGQIVMGGAMGALIGAGGALVGVVAERTTTSSCDDWCGLIGAASGFAVGYTFGSALGVKIIGSRGNETGSFAAGLLGAAAGFSIWYIASARGRDGVSDGALATFVLWPPIGATLFFNQTRRYENSSPQNHALLNFDNKRLRLGVPAIVVRPVHSMNAAKVAGAATILSMSF